MTKVICSTETHESFHMFIVLLYNKESDSDVVVIYHYYYKLYDNVVGNNVCMKVLSIISSKFEHHYRTVISVIDAKDGL